MLSKRSLSRLTLVCAVVLVGAIFYTIQNDAEAKNAAILLGQDKELILQIDGMNEKNTVAIRKGIESYDGVVFKGICHTNHVLMYVVDRDIQPTDAFLTEVLGPMNLTYNIKTGSSISQVQEQCPDQEQDNSSQTE